ncbi:MAG: hypothetical protein ACI9WU_005297 [Myxococcota bacterium]|jgi:hypothetical protein
MSSAPMTAVDGRLRLILLVAGIYVGGLVVPEGGQHVTAAAAGETLESAIRRNVGSFLEHQRAATVSDPNRDVAWIDAPDGDLGIWDTLDHQMFMVLAAPRGTEKRDLFRMEARVTPYGRIFDVTRVVNLTRTAAADDSALVVSGHRVATAVRYGGRIVGIDVRDLTGEVADRVGTADWGRARRIGNMVTNIEETGSSAGIDFDHYLVDAAVPESASLRWVQDTLQLVDTQTREVVATVDAVGHKTAGKIALTHLPPQPKMRYQFLNWLADRGRGLADKGLLPEWAGNSIELMKEVYFKAKEVQAEIQEAAVDEPIEVEAPEVVERAVERARFQAGKSSRPWPPSPLEPMLGERAKGEGLWTAVGADVVQQPPNAPHPFYRTFVRAEPDFKLKRVYITTWDPAQIQILMRAGTHEPEPQTGHRGDGAIPRNKEHLSKVVGGFNGGFQTSHIWYGMMVDRKVLLRPREKGATVGSWADGRTAFGTWRPRGKIPADLTHFRQNLSALVEFGKFNPYRRTKWGWSRGVAGVEGGHTIRTAVCVNKTDRVMFFYSEFSTAQRLAEVLLHAGCDFGTHLDMNKGHTGFEWYRQLEPGPTVKDDPSIKAFEELGLRMQGTSLHPTVKHMKAPTRYLGVDYRDYFYLRLRDVLPGADLAAPDGADKQAGRWRVEGLPHNAEHPPRIATTTLPVAGGTLQILQLDPAAVALEALPVDADQSSVTRATLMATLPIGLVPAGGSEKLAVGDITISGASAAIPGASTAATDDQVLENATVWGLDNHGMLWVIGVAGARISDAVAVLAKRGVSRPIWTRPEAQGDARTLVYQPTINQAQKAAWIEAEPGSDEGEVVMSLTTDVPRLQIHSRARASSIVRLFPLENQPKK